MILNLHIYFLVSDILIPRPVTHNCEISWSQIFNERTKIYKKFNFMQQTVCFFMYQNYFELITCVGELFNRST